MHLRNRMFISFFIISIVPLAIITFIIYNRYTEIIDEQTSQVADSVYSKAVNEIDTALEKIDQIYQMFTLYTVNTSSVMEDIVKYAEGGSYDEYDVFLSNQKMKFVCQSAIFSNDYVNGVFLFTPSGVTLGYGYGGNTDIYYGYDPSGDAWYSETLELNGGTYIDGITVKKYIINARPSVTFSRSVYEPVSQKFLGVLVVDCEPGLFDLDVVNTLPELIYFSVENVDTGYILYTNVDELLSKQDIDRMNVSTTKLHYDNIVLTTSVNYPQLYRQFSSTQQVIVAIGVTCAFAIITLSILFSNAMAKPITHISRQMADRSGHNRVNNERYLRRRDEVGVLCNEYNALLDELERTVVSEYQHRLIMLDAQMRSLEAQIDSHFLYNTLESINSIAEIEHVESIATISLALGNMFRYSIKTKSELVTVEEELGHVGDFVSIQQIRFDNAFKLELNLSDELQGMKVLKLIMQPLVENAIKHGLRNCQSGDRIRITGYFDSELITLRVEDNGTGMSEGQLGSLREALAKEPRFSDLGQRDSASIGLKNIQSRIELYYGKDYGLSIESKIGEGTSVTVRIPRSNAL